MVPIKHESESSSGKTLEIQLQNNYPHMLLTISAFLLQYERKIFKLKQKESKKQDGQPETK